MKEISIFFSSEESFAAYSLPGSTDHFLVFAEDKGVACLGDSLFSSFIVAPFDENGTPAQAIPAEIIVKNDGFSFQVERRSNVSGTNKKEYLASANDTINRIRRGQFEKVVLSKVKVVESQQDNLYDLFLHLKLSYPEAFTFIYHTPQRGCWIGASPEILVRENGDELVTMALAGTQRDKGLDLNEVNWSAKEVHEHAVIEDYIREIFNETGLPYSCKGPFTHRAADILHIRTDFTVHHNTGLLNLARLLHPGPAICGCPQTKALEYINSLENHLRQDYCGFLGPYGIEGESAFFINIRSMRVYGNQYVLYLGGGLTTNSEANSEWEETELKAQTLMAVLEKSYS